MHLPGGLPESGALRTDFAFKGINGQLELMLAERNALLSLPEQVTQVLVQALDHLAGKKPKRERVAALCVGDRQFLMRQLAIALGYDSQWMNADCHACGERFDFQIQLSQLPTKAAGEGFPEFKVQTSKGKLCLRLPTGDDQVAIAHISDAQEARRVLLERCLISRNGRAVRKYPELDEDDLQQIDDAMEALAPEPVTQLGANCPTCGKPNLIALEPYELLNKKPADIFAEIHTLAWYYHWSEAEILAMPKERRNRYLALIDRSRGFDGAREASVHRFPASPFSQQAGS